MILSFFLLIVGFFVLIKGADLLVTGASSLAKRYNVPELAIGLTIVAFGTSAPEMVVNGVASYEGHTDVVLGNVVGSNIFNTFFILGIAGVVYPLSVQKSTVFKEIPYSLFGGLLILFFANDVLLNLGDQNIISVVEGVILFVFFLLFLVYVFFSMKKGQDSSGDEPIKVIAMPKTILFMILGLIGLTIGGKLVVSNAIDIARYLQVSEQLIGLTIMAAGTSLPELATSVVAATQKKSDLAVGNIVGSNIFNMFFVLSISSMINPIPYPTIFNVDMITFMAGTVILFIAMFTGEKKILDRWEALILLMFFVFYNMYLVYRDHLIGA
ncbi:calcium/sodium antiporter [uncultured Imperialibacter sp.]|uniref:calcium/sodium antiporter n=1 Tax=uncultured Imperialibacter sp. TaxID=1672639 RepID=UPI0030D8B7C5|tara:strand:+ start:50349 stop:51326 length:978 start_codon:yes stop_codon:yes gene_type:complete